MRKILIVLSIVLALILAGLLLRILQVTMVPASPMVLLDDTRPKVFREASASSWAQRAGTVIEVRVPAGMQFVASRKGKKYYPVDSAGGERIVPENRVYFRTAVEAEAAGYVR